MEGFFWLAGLMIGIGGLCWFLNHGAMVAVARNKLREM